MEQSDIVPVLKKLEFDKSPEAKKWGGKGELVVNNPPTFKVSPVVETGE